MIQSRVPPVTSSVYRNGVRRRALDQWSKPFPITDSFEYPLAASCPQPQTEGTRTQTMGCIPKPPEKIACVPMHHYPSKSGVNRYANSTENPEVHFPDIPCITDSAPSACLRPQGLATPENGAQIIYIRLQKSPGYTSPTVSADFQ